LVAASVPDDILPFEIEATDDVEMGTETGGVSAGVAKPVVHVPFPADRSKQTTISPTSGLFKTLASDKLEGRRKEGRPDFE
jgi:hypothetical protein